MYLTNFITAYTTVSRTSSTAMLIIALPRLSPSSHINTLVSRLLTVLTTPTTTWAPVLLVTRLLPIVLLAVELTTELVLAPATFVGSEPEELAEPLATCRDTGSQP